MLHLYISSVMSVQSNSVADVIKHHNTGLLYNQMEGCRQAGTALKEDSIKFAEDLIIILSV